MPQAVDRQAFFPFPTLHGAGAALEVGGDFFPGIQPVFRLPAPNWGNFLNVNVVRHLVRLAAASSSMTQIILFCSFIF